MLEKIETFAIASSTEGPSGLALPHLGRGEILEAIWLPPFGLKIRTERGCSWVEMKADVMEKHWGGESFLQILETNGLQKDNCWLVPLTGAPQALISSLNQGVSRAR